ncbi:hypothetical protein ACFVZD_47060 [Streptomyces sp. NPDC058287]|uniref:hypothetical protein n=1 Tax=Streptomyces sp. NPDC058287 TaxID=3346423 RepID=UPI0036E5AC82
MTIERGQYTVLPVVPSMRTTPQSQIAAQLLAQGERFRLQQAHLYYVTADMTALALAAAATSPAEAVSADRMPAAAGLMVFAEPIGGYSMMQPGAEAEVTVPIIAVSWGRWAADDITIDGDSRAVKWMFNTGGTVKRIPSGFEGIWMTFYTPNDNSMYEAMAPEAVVGIAPDGKPTTAADILSLGIKTPLTWDNETVLGFGAHFDPNPDPDTTAEWSATVYTAWQLITQGGARLTETAEIPRPRSGRKRDVREGITDSGAVRVINVHSTHRPSASAGEQDAQASDGRRAPQYACRWPVRLHRRDQCMNPAAHKGGDCHHEERVILPYIKGPDGAPLRVRDTVNLWDHQPEQSAP